MRQLESIRLRRIHVNAAIVNVRGIRIDPFQDRSSHSSVMPRILSTCWPLSLGFDMPTSLHYDIGSRQNTMLTFFLFFSRMRLFFRFIIL